MLKLGRVISFYISKMSHDIIQPLKICDIDKGFQRKCRIKTQTCFFMLHRRANMNIYDLDFDTMLHIL